MKIKIENKDYEVNIKRAIELGIAEEIITRPPVVLITSIQAGDVFEYGNSINSTRIRGVVGVNADNTFYLTGRTSGFDNWSANGFSYLSRSSFIEYLNHNGSGGNPWKFVKNIGDKVHRLIYS